MLSPTPDADTVHRKDCFPFPQAWYPVPALPVKIREGLLLKGDLKAPEGAEKGAMKAPEGIEKVLQPEPRKQILQNTGGFAAEQRTLIRPFLSATISLSPRKWQAQKRIIPLCGQWVMAAMKVQLPERADPVRRSPDTLHFQNSIREKC